MIDQKTDRLKLPLPNADNFLEDDVGRIREALTTLDRAATVDAGGVIVSSQLPVDLAYLDANRKIPVENLPAIAISETFIVDNQAAMLKLDADVGDIAVFADNSANYILAKKPASLLANWKELIGTQVRTVNNRTGNVTVAEAGANKDITSLGALQGPLQLGGDAQGDYDAVTLKQLRAASGGSGGASMNGVMNNALGAAVWFNGTRAKVWAGHLPADGQLLKRADYPDLWAAVNSGMFVSVDDTTWLNANGVTYVHRGKFSTGDGSTTFRLPDLNGMQTGSLDGLFLSGTAKSASATVPARDVGVVWDQNAPNITGENPKNGNDFAWRGNTGIIGGDQSGAIKIDGVGKYAQGTGPLDATWFNWSFDASRSNKTYSSTNSWLIPRSVAGIWLIRVNGTFSAAGTAFNVINGDTAKPANGIVVYGGDLRSSYQIAGVDNLVASLRTKQAIGGDKYAELVLTDYSGSTPTSVNWGFRSDGATVFGNGAYCSSSGSFVTNTGIMASGFKSDFGFRKTLDGMYSDGGRNRNLFAKCENNITQRWEMDCFDTGQDIQFRVAVFNGNALNTLYCGINGAGDSQRGSFAYAASDSELKNIEGDVDADDAIQRIEALRPREFSWKSDGRKDRGFIAQEAHEADERYAYDSKPFWGLSDRAILADLVATVKALRQEVAELKAANSNTTS